MQAGQDGIQRLLAAEQEAQKIIAQARKGKHPGQVRVAVSSLPAYP